MAKARKKPVIKTQYNEKGKVKGEGYEKNIQPSKTVPDDALSIQDIVERGKQGRMVQGAKEPMYYDQEMPNLQKLDYAEIQQIVKNNWDQIQTAKRQEIQAEENRKKAEVDLWKQSYIEFEEFKRNNPGQGIKKGGENED